MRLSEETKQLLAERVERPGYDRTRPARRIVHLGIGAFHRAHQAVYTDDANRAGGEQWSIIGVSLRSEGARDQMAPQDGLFTVTARSAQESAPRLIGSVGDVLFAPESPDRLVDILADEATAIVTLTVTEKGYLARPDGSLDRGNADLASEADGGAPRTIYGFLAAAMAKRRAEGRAGLTLLSCDNLSENGKRLERLLLDYLGDRDTALADWCREHCRFPNSMVDRIVPATAPADLDALEAAIGLRDEAGVFTEPFRQWVIEEDFAGPRPGWEAGGAEIVSDVRPYETAKLRMLNGAHSALAYLGLEKGLALVSEAITDPDIGPLVSRLMREEAAPAIAAAPGQDLMAYADALERRFDNPSLPHRLEQIATDGSQKIAQRWLATLSDRQQQNASCPAILEALAAWIVHVRGDGAPVRDPLAEQLAELWRSAGADSIVDALFGRDGMFADQWQPSDADLQFLEQRVKLKSA